MFNANVDLLSTPFRDIIKQLQKLQYHFYPSLSLCYTLQKLTFLYVIQLLRMSI